MHITGKLNIVNTLKEVGATSTIVKIFATLPFAQVVVGCIGLVSIIFMATSFDSASYTLAMVSSKGIKVTEEPKRWLRVFWALAIALIPAVMIVINGQLQTLQTLSIAMALPVTVVYVLIYISLIKYLNKIGSETSIF